MISFWHGKTKVWVSIEEQTNMSKKVMPLYTEGMNMLDALADEEVDVYLEENPKIVSYVTNREEELDEPNREVTWELRQAQETLERDISMSQ